MRFLAFCSVLGSMPFCCRKSLNALCSSLIFCLSDSSESLMACSLLRIFSSISASFADDQMLRGTF